MYNLILDETSSILFIIICILHKLEKASFLIVMNISSIFVVQAVKKYLFSILSSHVLYVGH